MLHAFPIILLSALLALTACSEGGGAAGPSTSADGAVRPSVPGPTDDDDLDDASAAPSRSLDAGSLIDAAITQKPIDRPDGGASKSRNESFETALPIEPGSSRLQDVVHEKQSNFFTFEAASVGFYEFKTESSDFSPDVVLKVYDASRTLIAQNDNGSLFPGDEVDARLVLRLPKPGRYFVEVSDPYTPARYFNSELSLLFYHLDARELVPGAVGVSHAGSTVAEARFSIDETSGYSFVTLVGALEPSGVDEFSFTGLENQALIGHLLPSGMQGNGSSATTAQVRVLNTDRRLLGVLDGQHGEAQIFPPVTTGTHTVTVAAPPTVGDNGFYAVDLVMLPDNPREQAETANAQLSGAEALMFDGPGRRRALFLSDVPDADVDYYRLDAAKGESIVVSCEGQSAGSGVRDLKVELRDEADQVLSVAVESPAHEHDLDRWVVTTPGVYYVRLSSVLVSAAQEAEPWVRCVVLVR